jgi:hypothetical protein
MINHLKSFLLDNWASTLPAIAPPKKDLKLLLTKGSLGGYGGKVSFFLFTDNQPDPAAIIKTTRRPEYSQLLESEYGALMFIQKNISSHLSVRVPKAFFLGRIGSFDWLIEEAVTGRSADEVITNTVSLAGREKKAAAILNRAIDWLAKFAKESSLIDNRCLGAEALKEYFYDPIDKFFSLYEITGEEKRFLEDIKDNCANLEREGIPLVFGHGDFSPINIILSGEIFWIIDWAASKQKSLPLADFFFFLTWFNFYNYNSSAEGSVRLEACSQFFIKGSKYSFLSSNFLKEYCDILGLDKAVARVFFFLFLISQANEEYAILKNQADMGYILAVKPFDKGKLYKDGSILRSGIYVNLFRKFFKNKDNLIF